MSDTVHKDGNVFNGISCINIQTNSFTGSAIAGTFLGQSLTASFVPKRTLNPAETTVANVAQVLATLIMDLGTKH